MRRLVRWLSCWTIAALCCASSAVPDEPAPGTQRLLYVASPGVRDYVEWGGHGVLGFEIGDLRTGERLHRVEVEGFAHGQPKRHGCPSHGIGPTPDETEIWLCDGFNSHLHIFDATVMPPKLVASIALREQPGWVTFPLDGELAYPSTGEVIDVKSRKIIATLSDEEQRPVHSEKMLEIQFRDGKPIANGDQFGLGRVR